MYILLRILVLSNAPDTYTVIDPEGSIQSKNCVDLILRVSDPPVDTGSHVEHKFRVQIAHYGDRRIIGKRDFGSVIHWGNLPPHLAALEAAESAKPQQGSRDPSFQQVTQGPSSPSSSTGLRRSDSVTTRDHPTGGNFAGHQPNYIVIITAVFCIIGLMLPITGSGNCGGKDAETSSPSTLASSTTSMTLTSLIPSYLHVTMLQKLLAAYALGLVTMVIFRHWQIHSCYYCYDYYITISVSCFETANI